MKGNDSEVMLLLADGHRSRRSLWADVARSEGRLHTAAEGAGAESQHGR